MFHYESLDFCGFHRDTGHHHIIKTGIMGSQQCSVSRALTVVFSGFNGGASSPGLMGLSDVEERRRQKRSRAARSTGPSFVLLLWDPDTHAWGSRRTVTAARGRRHTHLQAHVDETVNAHARSWAN